MKNSILGKVGKSQCNYSSPENKRLLHISNKTKVIINSLLIVVFLVIFPVILGWGRLSLDSDVCPTPNFALLSQDLRKNGNNHDYSNLEFNSNPDDLDSVTFNSLIILKIKFSCDSVRKITFRAELNQLDVNIPASLKSQADLYFKDHDFTSQEYFGPFSEKEIYFEIDLSSTRTPIVPGMYELKFYYIKQDGVSIEKLSTIHEYTLNIHKDKVAFYPQYSEDPLKSDRRGCIYSALDTTDLSYLNTFEANVRNSLMQPVQGHVDLYLVEREMNSYEYKKLIDIQIKDNAAISYTKKTYNHYGPFMRGKMVYDGEQSLIYETAIHQEDSERITNKFVNTNHHELNDEEIYSGSLQEYDKNDIKPKKRLFYLQEFSAFEPQWIKSPGFNFISQDPDFLYYDISESSQICIESPLITYLGTVADQASLEYKYQIFNFESLDDDIWIDLTSQIIRDNEVVHEQVEYQGYYNEKGGNWNLVIQNLSRYFTEGGQQFKIKIKANFTYSQGSTHEISLRFDYVKLDVSHPSTFYREFGFYNGLNEFAASILSDSEVYYWDDHYPIRVGGEIISLENSSDDVNHDGFGIFAPLNPEKSLFSSEFLINNRVSLKDLDFLQDDTLIDSDLNLIDLNVNISSFYYSVNQSKPPGSPILGSLTCELMVLVESNEKIDLTVSDELLYNDWENSYEFKNLNLTKLLEISSNELLLELDENSSRINTLKNELLFELSKDEKESLFLILEEIRDQSFEDVYFVFEFKLQVFNHINVHHDTGVNLWFNSFQLVTQWENLSGCQSQIYSLDRFKDPYMFL